MTFVTVCSIEQSGWAKWTLLFEIYFSSVHCTVHDTKPVDELDVGHFDTVQYFLLTYYSTTNYLLQ